MKADVMLLPHSIIWRKQYTQLTLHPPPLSLNQIKYTVYQILASSKYDVLPQAATHPPTTRALQTIKITK